MRTKWLKLLWYEILVSYPEALWILPLLATCGLLILADIQSDDATRFEQISAIAEIIFPLLVMFLSNRLILHELEEKTIVFVAIRSSLTKLWLRRLSTLLLMSTFWLGILLTAYYFFYLPISIGQMLAASISVSLALVGVTNTFALMLKEINVGYLVGIFLWATCLISPRFAFDVLGPRLYLFYLWFASREGISLEVWLYNKLILGGLGLLFIGICVLFLLHTERFSN